MLKELTSDGIFNVDSHAWKMHPKMASKIFAWNLLRNRVKISEQNLCQVCTFIHDVCVRSAEAGRDSDGDHSIDLQDLYFRFKLDSAAFIVFPCIIMKKRRQ